MPAHPNTAPAVVERLRAFLSERLAALDRASAVAAALEAVETGEIDIESLYGEVLVPLLVDTGARWQRGTTQVWEEHFATSVVRTIVEALQPLVAAASADVPRIGKVAVLACPPGEQHDLGLRMLADRMQLAGWEAHFLGADTPVDQIAAAARAVHADLVALSAATHYNVVLAHTTVRQLAAALPGVRVAVGGPGVRCAKDWPEEFLLTEESLGLTGGHEPMCEG